MSELQRAQAAIRADATRSREVETAGPFVCTFTPDTANGFLNYAIPEAGAEPSAADVAELEAVFAPRGRRPRLEYVTALAPAVEPALRDAGFEVELRTPLLVFRDGDAVQPPEGYELVEARTEAAVREVAAVQHEAYEDPEPVTDAAIRRMLASVGAGGLLCLARQAASGEPAGAGACTRPHESACELTSVGVRERHRRRGLACALASHLAGAAAARGVETIFLMAHGQSETRIYERAGFTQIGEVLHVSKAHVS